MGPVTLLETSARAALLQAAGSGTSLNELERQNGLQGLGAADIEAEARPHRLTAGQDPYSAGVHELGCPWLDAVAPTWRDSPAPYGPVFLVLAALAAKVGGSLTGTLAVLRIIAVLGVVLTAVCLPVLARRRGVPLGRAVWLALACPLVAIHLVSGAHNDAVMVGLLVAALAIRLGAQARSLPARE